MQLTQRNKGLLMVIAGAAMWGGSGVAGQYLLQDCGASTGWLVVTRMLLAGLILLGLDALWHRDGILMIWRDRRDVRELLIFSIAGRPVYLLCLYQSGQRRGGHRTAIPDADCDHSVYCRSDKAPAAPHRAPVRGFGSWRDVSARHTWQYGHTACSVGCRVLGAGLRCGSGGLYHDAEAADPQMAGYPCRWLGHADWGTRIGYMLSSMADGDSLDHDGRTNLCLYHIFWHRSYIRLLSGEPSVHSARRSQHPWIGRALVRHSFVHIVPAGILWFTGSAWLCTHHQHSIPIGTKLTRTAC